MQSVFLIVIYFFSVNVNDRCKLFCQVLNGTAYYLLNETVIDGTKCDQETDDMCVAGSCRVCMLF